jgi:transcriptional regulator of acetoin/glycerol metabolism
MERNSGTIQQAAARLGVHRPSLHRKMRTLGLRAPKRRAATLDG